MPCLTIATNVSTKMMTPTPSSNCEGMMTPTPSSNCEGMMTPTPSSNCEGMIIAVNLTDNYIHVQSI